MLALTLGSAVMPAHPTGTWRQCVYLQGVAAAHRNEDSLSQQSDDLRCVNSRFGASEPTSEREPTTLERRLEGRGGAAAPRRSEEVRYALRRATSHRSFPASYRLLLLLLLLLMWLCWALARRFGGHAPTRLRRGPCSTPASVS